MAGCREPEPPEFEPNYVHAYKLALANEVSMDQPLADTQWALERMFGTPDDPRLPDIVAGDPELAAVVDIEQLHKAAGANGLYAKHCATCHGVTGHGRGLTAALLDPYPRDYRAGIFKYKSTPRGRKPTHEDLARRIAEGVPGTAMKPIPELTQRDIDALADYVIYLSMRGEVERRMLDEAAFDLDLEAGERLVDPSLQATDPETFDEQWGYMQDHAIAVAESWLDAADQAVEVEAPGDLPATKEEVLAAVQSGHPSEVVASVERGRELFTSERAACAKCHGPKGHGDGQTDDYDEWAKDWTTRIGLSPENEDALVPLIARGALPPRKAMPRDFRWGEYRGGSRPEDLYLRISQGIDGTPMPAAPLTPKEIWDLVNFVRSLYQPELEEGATQEAMAST